MKKKLGRKLADIIFGRIEICNESQTLRAEGCENAFRRKRKLTAERVVSMILTPAKQSLTTRLCEFGVKFMGGEKVSKQAFSKRRQFVNPDYIREFYDECVDELLRDGELETFKGMHLTAIDGTRIACENTPELIEEFSCSGPNKEACTALASVAYDMIERVSFDCQIGSYSLSERTLLDRHLDRLETFGAENFLIAADRGYPSYDLMETLIDKGFNFVLRIPESWKNAISWLDEVNDKDLEYESNSRTYSFRVLKIELTDKIEYLVTNLDRDVLSLEEAQWVYSLRWNVETFYGFAKTEFELENFSGKTKNAVLQEFYATMTLANLCQCFINDADAEISAVNEGKNLKYLHQANRRQCIGRIVPVFLECVFTESKRRRVHLWKQVEEFCASFSQPIRPNRIVPRKPPRNRKFYHNSRKPRLS